MPAAASVNQNLGRMHTLQTQPTLENHEKAGRGAGRARLRGACCEEPIAAKSEARDDGGRQDRDDDAGQ